VLLGGVPNGELFAYGRTRPNALALEEKGVVLLGVTGCEPTCVFGEKTGCEKGAVLLPAVGAGFTFTRTGVVEEFVAGAVLAVGEGAVSSVFMNGDVLGEDFSGAS